MKPRCKDIPWVLLLGAHLATLAGCTAASPRVADLARRAAEEEAVLVASVEPVIRELLREWEPWGRTFAGKPVVTDYRGIPETYGYVKVGETPFRPATAKEIENHHKHLIIMRCVEIDGVLMRPQGVETREIDTYDIQAIERVYSYAFERVERVQRTADPAFPFEAIIRVNVTTHERVTSKERVELTPDPPEGYRRLTKTEMANWRQCRDGFTLYGGCDSIHSPRHRMAAAIRDLDLPLPGLYHSYPNRAGRYYSGLSDDSPKHPQKVQEVIDRHVEDWEKMEPSISWSLETVSLWYSLKDDRWVVRRPEKPKFTDQNMED